MVDYYKFGLRSTEKIKVFVNQALFTPEDTPERIVQQESIKHTLETEVARSEKFIADYLRERVRKQDMIDEKVIAKSDDCELTDLEEF